MERQDKTESDKKLEHEVMDSSQESSSKSNDCQEAPTSGDHAQNTSANSQESSSETGNQLPSIDQLAWTLQRGPVWTPINKSQAVIREVLSGQFAYVDPASREADLTSDPSNYAYNSKGQRMFPARYRQTYEEPKFPSSFATSNEDNNSVKDDESSQTSTESQVPRHLLSSFQLDGTNDDAETHDGNSPPSSPPHLPSTSSHAQTLTGNAHDTNRGTSSGHEAAGIFIATPETVDNNSSNHEEVHSNSDEEDLPSSPHATGVTSHEDIEHVTGPENSNGGSSAGLPTTNSDQSDPEFICWFSDRCNTGQTSRKQARKCVSNFFGRNRSSTMAMETITFCRKHYQRASYNHLNWQKQKLSTWIPAQLELIQQTWGKDTKFELTLKKSEKERLQNYSSNILYGRETEDPNQEIPADKVDNQEKKRRLKAKKAAQKAKEATEESHAESSAAGAAREAEQTEYQRNVEASLAEASARPIAPAPSSSSNPTPSTVPEPRNRRNNSYQAPLSVLDDIRRQWGGSGRTVEDVHQMLEWIRVQIDHKRITEIPLFELVPQIDEKIIEEARLAKGYGKGSKGKGKEPADNGKAPERGTKRDRSEEPEEELPASKKPRSGRDGHEDDDGAGAAGEMAI